MKMDLRGKLIAINSYKEIIKEFSDMLMMHPSSEKNTNKKDHRIKPINKK